MSSKKKKLTPREMARKEERKKQHEKEKKRARLFSALAVTAGCVGSSFFWPKDNMVLYIGLCVLCGVVFGVAFDLIYLQYMKKKGNRR